MEWRAVAGINLNTSSSKAATTINLASNSTNYRLLSTVFIFGNENHQLPLLHLLFHNLELKSARDTGRSQLNCLHVYLASFTIAVTKDLFPALGMLLVNIRFFRNGSKH